jgi:5-methylcytosine-specific restriction endonuclease McrA
MEVLRQRMVLEKFLINNGIEVPPGARMSHLGRRFNKYFPQIAGAANPGNDTWRPGPLLALAEYVASLPDDPVAPVVPCSPYKRKAVPTSFRPTSAEKQAFLQSDQYRRVRFEVLKKHGYKCQCCGATGHERRIEVDHIKPLSRYWHLRADRNNLQVLCHDCNVGKGARTVHDFRPCE